MMSLMAIGLPLGLLGTISLGALYDFRMNMVAGAFWLLLSPTLARFGMFFGLAGVAVGLFHLAYLYHCIKTGQRYKMKLEAPIHV